MGHVDIVDMEAYNMIKELSVVFSKHTKALVCA
jgi:hypothetical protein